MSQRFPQPSGLRPVEVRFTIFPTRAVVEPSLHRHIPAEIRAAGLADWHNGSSRMDHVDTTNDLPRHPTASKVLHEVAHPIRTIKSHHKRKAEDPPMDSSTKKQRADHAHNDADDVAHAYEGGGASAVYPSLDASKVLSVFRLGLNRLKRKNKYQILYFPLTEPLNEEQRWSRRDLTCLKVV
ncbi:hypothetical protein EVJ58_g2778 [Rhodofomes roseus]|uniref:Uncharacterized protein n=1 Tax=Rhodofomes roseus TaxID=34475 RepID=A0A4Y9YP54_9APHY|nr:hypothetical protein EVJ58_g2778 [Rhodofomes roseus]